MKGLHRLIIIAILVIVTSTFTLYQIKHSTQINMKIIQNIEEQIAQEQKEIQLLNIELSHLSQPERISKLKDKLLPTLEPINKDQIMLWNPK